jgi:hypothetical protein
MMDENTKKIVDDNYMFITLLGYSLAILHKFESYADENMIDTYDKASYQWYKDAITNLIYLKKPPPPMP